MDSNHSKQSKNCHQFHQTDPQRKISFAMILHFKSDACQASCAATKGKIVELPAIFELGNHLFTRAPERDTELGIRNEVWERGSHVPFPPPQSTALGSLPSPIFFLFHPVSFPFPPVRSQVPGYVSVVCERQMFLLAHRR